MYKTRWRRKGYGFSSYAYCLNNPVKYIDPDGRWVDDYFNENGRYLGSDSRITNNIRIMKQSDWDRAQSEHSQTMFSSSIDLLQDLDNNSRILSIESAGSKFKNMWNKSYASNKENIGYVVFNFDNATLTFEPVTARATNRNVDLDYRAGDKFGSSGIVLGNAHTHPDEHTYLGKTLKGGAKITDEYIFNYQYSKKNSDGRAASYNGSTYTISKHNIDYYSKYGKPSSVNNISTNRALQNNKFHLLKHALYEYNK